MGGVMGLESGGFAECLVDLGARHGYGGRGRDRGDQRVRPLEVLRLGPPVERDRFRGRICDRVERTLHGGELFGDDQPLLELPPGDGDRNRCLRLRCEDGRGDFRIGEGGIYSGFGVGIQWGKARDRVSSVELRAFARYPIKDDESISTNRGGMGEDSSIGSLSD